MKRPGIGTAMLAGGRRVIAVSAVAATLTTGAAGAVAAQITFSGVTTYRFNSANFTATATLGGLTVTEGGFSATSSPLGYAAVGGTNNNLGLVSLAGSNVVYDGATFQLKVAFTSPTAPNTTFSASVIGAVVSFGGGVHILFNPRVITGIPFSNASGSGTFDFMLNDVAVSPGQPNAQLTGDIHNVKLSPSIPR